MTKPRLATVWLDGCSGCHMSFLDMDERLLEIGRARRHRLQPAGRRQGVPRPASTSASSKGRSPARTTSTRSSSSASGRGRWSRSATARSPPTCPGMRNPIGAQPAARARLPRERHPTTRQLPSAGGAGAAADGPAGPPGRQGRRLPARLPALGRPHLPRARRAARGPRCRTPRRRPLRRAEGGTP